MIELFKILSGKYDKEVSDFVKLNCESVTRGHSLKIFKERGIPFCRDQWTSGTACQNQWWCPNQ